MRKPTWILLAAALVLMAVLAAAIFRLPPIYNRLSWRLDIAWTYVRTLVHPIRSMPTALPKPEVVQAAPLTPTPAPTATQTTAPTAVFTPTPLPSPTPLPAAVALPAPAWEKQDMNNCGPAALTMYLRFYGWEGNQETITQVIKPYRDDRNVNVEELAYYVRNHAGWLQVQYRVGGDLEVVKKLLAAGVPVMVEESFYFDEPYWTGDDLWAAHYQLITGYDDAAQTVIGQDSFRGPDQRIPYGTLQEYWQAFNYLYILIYPADKEATVKSILGDQWDEDANREHALEISKKETQADPKNAFAWFNLGSNETYFENYIDATTAYDQAREIGLPQRMLRYQFGPFIAYFHSGQIDDLVTLTEYALDVTPNSEEALLWHGWAMYRNGKINEAVTDFQSALEKKPGYQDAQYALDFVQNNP